MLLGYLALLNILDLVAMAENELPASSYLVLLLLPC